MADEEVITSFIWTIKNFDMGLNWTGDERLCSPTFCVEAHKFLIILYPTGKKYHKYISVFLKRPHVYDRGVDKLLVRWKMYPLGGGGGDEYNYTLMEAILGNSEECGRHDFILRDKLLTTERSILLPNNNFSIKCDFYSLSVSEKNEDYNKFDVDVLSRDFADILNSGMYSDTVLIAKETKFHVHKVILESRGRGLRLYMQETEVPNEYMLSRIDPPVLRILLLYLYTGTYSVANMDDKIFLASHIYNIQDLRLSLDIPHYRTISGVTEIVISELSFRWVITNFSKLQLEQDLVYPAFCYTAEEWSNMKIILTIIRTENGSTGIQLKFRKLGGNWSNKINFIRCKISICKPKDSASNSAAPTTVQEYDYEYIFTSSNKDWIILLGSQIELSEILFNDSLNMFFEICMTKKDADSKIEKVLVKDKIEKADDDDVVKILKPFQKDLHNMFDNRANSKSVDISLSVGDVKFPVHKVILCGRSPVFAKMFENDSLEKKEGVVIIEDLDPETVASMLRYVYCGCIDEMDILGAIKLYSAADKYELLSLRDKCVSFLKTSMIADHVGELLLLADAHHDESLRRCVYDYMISNPTEVLESKDGLTVLQDRLDVYPGILHAFLEHASSNDFKRS